MKTRMLFFTPHPVVAVLSLTALLLGSGPASAQGTPEGWRGFYFGGGGTYSNVSAERPGSYCEDCYPWWGDLPSYDEGDGDYSYSLNAGYRVGRYFAVELEYVDGGTIGWEKPYVYMPELGGYYRNEVAFSPNIPEITALLIFPFLERWEVYARLGAGLWSATSEQRLTNVDTGEVIVRTADDDGVGFVVGLGLGFEFMTVLHARLEMQSAWIDGDALNIEQETTADTLLLELEYRFGARGAGAAAPSSPTSQP